MELLMTAILCIVFVASYGFFSDLVKDTEHPRLYTVIIMVLVALLLYGVAVGLGSGTSDPF